MELISRQAAIDVVAKTYRYESDRITALQELTVYEKNDWIPVEERIPEESLDSVLGWDEYRQRCCFVQYLGGRWILGNDIDSAKIIAWRPLPEPYWPNKRVKSKSGIGQDLS